MWNIILTPASLLLVMKACDACTGFCRSIGSSFRYNVYMEINMTKSHCTDMNCIGSSYLQRQNNLQTAFKLFDFQGWLEGDDFPCYGKCPVIAPEYQNRLNASITVNETGIEITWILHHLTSEDNMYDYVLSTAINQVELLEEMEVCFPKIRNCPDLESNQTNLYLGKPSQRNFNSNVTYECHNGSSLFVGEEQWNESAYNRTCLANASWTGQDDVVCKIAPTVLRIFLLDFDDKLLSANDNITAICSVSPGFPILFSANLYHGYHAQLKSAHHDGLSAGNLSISWRLSSADHKTKIICNASNDVGGNLANYTLQVQFPPYVKEVSTCSKNNGTEAKFTVTMVSNPGLQKEDLKHLWNQDGYELTLNAGTIEREIIGTSSTERRFSFSVKTALHQSSNFSLNVSHLFRNQSLVHSFSLGPITEACQGQAFTDVTPTTISDGGYHGTTGTMNIDLLIIALPAAGGTLVLATALLVYLLARRRKGSNKEEVTNPIYDSTPVMSKPIGPVPEKEERENPLYGTTSDATYAPVNKKNKKAKQASTSSQQAEANETYAMVNKIKEGKKKKGSDEQTKADETYMPLDKIKKGKKKKGADKNGQSNDGFSGAPEALYAAVNKKKDAAGGSDQPSTSGLGNNGDAAQECTYAAVQKKGNRKPKRDGSDDEDLHGSTKP